VPKFWPDHHEETSAKIFSPRLLNGLLATFLVIICTIFGAFILPLFKNKEKLFGQIMLFFTALAVSALSGAALMVLIPEGLGLDGCGARFEWQNLMTCGGIFMFFIIRRLLHLVTGHDDVFTQELRGHAGEPNSMWVENQIVKTSEMGSENSENAKMLLNSSDSSTAQITLEINNKNTIQDTKPEPKKSLKQSLKTMKSVGWMTLLGDSAHNFLDGVAIGATFHQPGCASKAIAKGWQVTIAVLAEEFPHELGDFAVLLRSGLSCKEAIFCNLFSGSTCMLGYIVGWKFGEDLGLQVFSWMGGVFLFISLGCMLPEVETTITDLNEKFNKSGSLKVLLGFKLIAVMGFVMGYGIVFCSGKYIDFDESSCE
jgi:zinc transporter ZupT